jgi:hypothetical protein
MQCAHFDVLVDVLLKWPDSESYRGELPSNTVTSDSSDQVEISTIPPTPSHHGRGIIDLSEITLDDIPPAIEERLRKTKGIFSVQINAFSQKLVVEFDTTAVSLDKIIKMISQQSKR